MDVLKSIIVGLVQGLTEFLPISSTAHMTLAGKFLNLIDPASPEKWTAFMAIVQLGTLASIFAYFKKEVIEIPIAFLKENLGSKRAKFKEQSQNSKMGWMIILGTLPIVTVGLLLKKVIEGNLTKSFTVIGTSLIVLAVVLFIAERMAKFKREMNELTMKDAIWVGLAQCLALFPGASRSGTTITAGLFLGMKRDTAAKFSFLLSMPAILASGLLELKQSLHYINSADAMYMVIATVVAFVSGYLSIAFLINFLKKNSTLVFIIYRILLGVALLSFFV